MSRKEKEKEFFAYHTDKFRKAQVSDPYFTIKTAFFQKGKYGRQVQLFDGELKRGEDIFIEFIDIIRDESGKEQDVEPAFEDRPLFKYKNNPYFAEEYDVKEGTNSYERLFVASPPAYWKACRVCTNYIRKEEKEAFLGHCAVWQCVFDGLELSDSNVKAVKSVIKPLHKAFFESLGAPMSN